MDEQFSVDLARRARPKLEAVVFDAGGTLVRLDFEWMSGMLAELGLAVTAEDVRRAEVQGRRRYDASAGRAPATPALGPHPPLGSVGSNRAYFAGTLEAVGCRHPLLEEALERMQETQAPPSRLWARPMEGARHALDALATLGVRACCVSNSDGRAEQHLVECGVRDGLEFVVDSQLEGVEKPDPRIFGIALARLGLPAERTVYVGDIRSVDEAGARGAGMHFVLIDPFGDYAGPGTLAVPGPAELPAWLAANFELVATRGNVSPDPALPGTA
jgi:HAD superfamily hydrolase (TIGR01509 family)